MLKTDASKTMQNTHVDVGSNGSRLTGPFHGNVAQSVQIWIDFSVWG